MPNVVTLVAEVAAIEAAMTTPYSFGADVAGEQQATREDRGLSIRRSWGASTRHRAQRVVGGSVARQHSRGQLPFERILDDPEIGGRLRCRETDS